MTAAAAAAKPKLLSTLDTERERECVFRAFELDFGGPEADMDADELELDFAAADEDEVVTAFGLTFCFVCFSS